jgi:hypothetical protein
MKYDRVVIKKSTNPKKKLMATFSKDNETKTKTIHFGSAGMDDYTKTKDKEQRNRYIGRHKAREDWSVPDTAGSLSKHILWGDSTSKTENIKNFKNKFKLK